MKYILSILITVFSLSTFAISNVDPLSAEVFAAKSPWQSLNRSFNYNPAATFAVPFQNLSNVETSYQFSGADINMHSIQAGNGNGNFRLVSESFKKEGAAHYFGKAYFERNEQYNTGWTDVEDYQLLNPYLVGDSVGGNYKRETYYLSGGTSLRLENWELAIRANYKGSVSYRQVDPRPRNTVSVFSIHPGITYGSGNWRYGWAGEYSRYRQNVDLRVEKDDKKIFFYLMQGFGIYNRQFSGLNSSYTRIYKGNLFRSNILVDFKNNQQATSVIVEASSNLINSDESDRRTPYKITHNQLETEINHEQKIAERSLFLKGKYNFHQTIGNETQYTPTTINANFVVWNFATQSDRYQSMNHNVEFTALYANKNRNKFSVWQQLDAIWNDNSQNYFFPDYFQNVQDLVTKGTIGIFYPMKKTSLTGSLGIGYKKVLSSSLFQDENNIMTTQLIVPDFEFLNSDLMLYRLNLQYRVPLSSKLLANITGDAGLQKSKDNRQAYSVQVSVAINF